VQPESPEAAYAITDRVLELCETLGVKSIITVGAYITGSISQAPKVYATATTPALVKELEATQLPLIKEGEITWMNGLILGLAKVRNIPAVFYAGETSGLPHLEDTKAAAAVLRVLDERVKLNLDPVKLQELANKTEDFLKSVDEFTERARTAKPDSGYIR
jgi:proteasome assembly chaperone (PAC2) family protein